MSKLQKAEGWEVRLDKLIMSYYGLPFERGQNCCFLFISDAYDALTDGKSPISEWRGQFSTKNKAMALYYKHTSSKTFEDVFQWADPVRNHNFAQRGDIGMMIEDDGSESLGIVSMNGRDFLVRCEDHSGLVRFPLTDKVRLWRLE